MGRREKWKKKHLTPKPKPAKRIMAERGGPMSYESRVEFIVAYKHWMTAEQFAKYLRITGYLEGYKR